MKRKMFLDTSYLLSSAFYLNDSDRCHAINLPLGRVVHTCARYVAHEISHALLLFGRVWPGMDDATERKIDGMTATRANDHEMRTCALEMHGLWQLRQKITVHWIANQAWTNGLINVRASRKYRTKSMLERAIAREPVSPRLVGRFVRIYSDFARYA